MLRYAMVDILVLVAVMLAVHGSQFVSDCSWPLNRTGMAGVRVCLDVSIAIFVTN